MRLLVVSPYCNGEDIGESRCSFELVSRLADRHDVTLVTCTKRGRPAVTPQLPQARVVEWSEPPLLGRAERFNSMLKPGYVPFAVRAARWVRQHAEEFDVAHQIGPLALRYPSPLATSGLPYVVGPVGGGLDDPPGFGGDDTAAWYVGLRRLDTWRLRHDRLLRRTFSSAEAVLGSAPYVEDLLHDVPLKRFVVEADTGIAALPTPTDRSGRQGPLRLLFVGRVVRTKGVRDLLHALDHLRDVPLVLDVAGDGFDRPACESLVAELGLGDRVTFLGRVPHDELDPLYRAADVFAFPSYREAGGIVVAEAMSYGLPLVVCDRGGPAHAVDDTCGIRVPLQGSPSRYAEDLAAALRGLAASPERRLALGAAARARVAELSLWDSKVDRVEQVYGQVLAAIG